MHCIFWTTLDKTAGACGKWAVVRREALRQPLRHHRTHARARAHTHTHTHSPSPQGALAREVRGRGRPRVRCVGCPTHLSAPPPCGAGPPVRTGRLIAGGPRAAAKVSASADASCTTPCATPPVLLLFAVAPRSSGSASDASASMPAARAASPPATTAINFRNTPRSAALRTRCSAHRHGAPRALSSNEAAPGTRAALPPVGCVRVGGWARARVAGRARRGRGCQHCNWP